MRARDADIADKIECLRAFLRGWDPEIRVASGAADDLCCDGPPARILAVGKAARALARGAAARWPGVPGFALEPAGGAPGPVPAGYDVARGDHPLSTSRSASATRTLYRWLEGTGGPTLALVSGGGSALLCDPPAPWTVAEAAALEKALLCCGAPIAEINAVRARLSGARGGGLRGRLGREPVWTGVWCDVARGHWRMTASAPTLAPVRRPAPGAVAARLGLVLPHPLPPAPAWQARPGDRASRLADAVCLSQDFARQLRGAGWKARTLSFSEGTSPGEAAAGIAAAAAGVRGRPAALVGAGEFPVAVTGAGRGGRCAHLACCVALEMGAARRWSFVALATDGVDGSAGGGAALSDRCRPRARELRRAVDACDTATVLEREGLLLTRRPTGNNLRDLWALFLP